MLDRYDNMATIDDLIKIEMLEAIPLDQVEPFLSAKPFYKLDGGLNTRDLSDGNYPNLKLGYAYRSGSLENLTTKGQDELVQLGVRTIFDLRSMAEFTTYPDPQIDGIDVIPAQIDSNYDSQAAETGMIDLGEMYLYMLAASKPGFRAILSHILEFPERPFLFHCAGRGVQSSFEAGIRPMY